MPEFEHLPKAPIIEALIDVRVRLPRGDALEPIHAFADAIESDYPDRRERTRGQVQLELSAPGAVEVAAKSATIDGLVLHSADGRQIVQGRLDGFTFSRLTPYQGWNDIQREARRLWQQYDKCVKPAAVQRLAVRCINRILLPTPVGQFSDWIKTLPVVAAGLPQSLAGFLLRLQMPFDELDARANVVLAVEPGDFQHDVPILFDIDAFLMPREALRDDMLWEKMDDLRIIKNNVFFETLTEKALELFR